MRLGRFSAILIVGAPGAGKGTQARFVSEALGIPHVSTGDLLREHRRRGTVLGLTAQYYMDRGDLVPDDLVFGMVMDRFDRQDAERGLLLDGFPRTLAQAQALDSGLRARLGSVRGVLYLDVPASALVGRLSGRRMCIACRGTFNVAAHPLPLDGTCPACGDRLFQRPDDTPAVVTHRVDVYLQETTPVLDHYEQQGLLYRVAGDRSIEAIRDELLAIVGREGRQETAPSSPATASRRDGGVSDGGLPVQASEGPPVSVA